MRAASRRSRSLGAWADDHANALMLAPAIVVLLLLVVLPTLYLFRLGLSRLEVAESNEPVFIGLGNFVHMFTDDPEFVASIGRSVFFLATAVPLEVILGLAIALLLNRRLRAIGILRVLMVMPMAMTPIVVGLTWLILYNPTHGTINYLLGLVGIDGPDWTSDPTLALPAIVAVDVWQWTPFMFLVFSAALATVPQDLLDAARVDGASRFQEFRSISLPHIRNVGLIAALILVIDSWKAFDSIYALTKGGPGTATETLNFYAFLQGFQWFHQGYAAALLMVGVLLAAVLTWAILRVAPDLLARER